MHDEDGAKGLHVLTSGPNIRQWKMYGDKNFLDKENEDNRNYCQLAVQASADEVFKAWKDKSYIKERKALEYLPTIESAFSTQNHAPLWSIQKRRDPAC